MVESQSRRQRPTQPLPEPYRQRGDSKRIEAQIEEPATLVHARVRRKQRRDFGAHDV
jgi:hypothetical protein